MISDSDMLPCVQTSSQPQTRALSLPIAFSQCWHFCIYPFLHAACWHEFNYPLDAIFVDPLRTVRQDRSFNQRVSVRGVTEDDNACTVSLAAPGIKAEQLHVERDILTVSGHTNHDAPSRAAFERQFKLKRADPETATAVHEDGILTIRVPKMPMPDPNRIVVCSTAGLNAEATDDEANDRATDEYTVTLAAPGIKASDIQVLASEQVLTVHGESERTKARVYRKITLPPDACDTSATASHIDGLLTVTVPARAPAQPAAKRIKVSAPGVAALSKETAADAS